MCYYKWSQKCHFIILKFKCFILAFGIKCFSIISARIKFLLFSVIKDHLVKFCKNFECLITKPDDFLYPMRVVYNLCLKMFFSLGIALKIRCFLNPHCRKSMHMIHVQLLFKTRDLLKYCWKKCCDRNEFQVGSDFKSFGYYITRKSSSK